MLYKCTSNRKIYKLLIKNITKSIDKIAGGGYSYYVSLYMHLIDSYVKDGYYFLYDYLDHLSPELAGTDQLPRNVKNIHEYVINNVDNTFVIATADVLYNDMKKNNYFYLAICQYFLHFRSNHQFHKSLLPQVYL